MSFSYSKNVHYQCTKCALCCGDTKKRTRHILLLKKDAERISEATSKLVEEFSVKIEGHEPYVYEMKKTGKKKCLFLKEDRCMIYAIRPLICRFYPLQLRIRDGKYRFSHTTECPGIGQGERLQESHFENLFRQACELLTKTSRKRARA